METESQIPMLDEITTAELVFRIGFGVMKQRDPNVSFHKILDEFPLDTEKKKVLKERVLAANPEFQIEEKQN